MRRTLFALSTLAFALPLAAQQVRVFTDGRTLATTGAASGDRAMLGISTSSGSKRDTLGVLVSSITEGGPAEKAGLAEGDRIQSINGVSLRVSRDDAGDDEMGGIMQRRLTRELGKAKAGDEVTLQVWHDGASKSYKIKTVAADELVRPTEARVKREERAVIGIGFGLTGSKRDTAGVFVNSVTEDGPAEKAGIVEGDRIAAINGVSLKLSKDDLEDSWVANSRLNRMSREVAKSKAGDVVELTVVSAGRARAVKVTLVKASSLKASEERTFTIFRSPDAAMAPMPPMPPMPPMGAMTFSAPRSPSAPHAPVIRFRSNDGDEAEVKVELEGVRKEIERTLRIELPKAREEMKRSFEEAAKAHGKAQQELQAARVNLRSARTIRM
ncbi:MAG: PDZ domain-containing protein [Gemmatimonadota bacterium]|nr:PDZ domain-containing protein [Gemmatimonadota bacterium]